MHYLYILYSDTTDRYYIGETHDVAERLFRHNNHTYKNSFTKIASDWQVALSRQCQNRQQAILLEKFIKAMKSKVFVSKIIADPSIIDDIVMRKKF